MNKKIKILISGALVSVLLFSSPFNSIQVKAIVGVDDAILFTILGLGAVTSIGAVYGMERSGAFEETGKFLGDKLQDFGNDWKTVSNSLAFAKSTITILPDVLDAFESLEGTEIEEREIIEGTTIPVFAPSTLFDNGRESSLRCLMTFDSKNSESYTISFPSFQSFTYTKPVYLYTISAVNGSSLQGCNKFYLSPNAENMVTKNGYFQLNMLSNNCVTIDVDYPTNSNVSVTVTSNCLATSSKTFTFPSIHDVTNKPTSISLDKTQFESIAQDYAERYPEDNNGDKEVDYNTLIPFFFDMLEKKLGDGTITPENLGNSGIVSYVYQDGSVQGMYPYNFTNEGISNVNNSNTNNIIINSGSDVSGEEKNGILNLIDGGFRATSERFENLSESFSGFKNTMSGIFSFFPQDVQNILFLSIILMAVFFVLGLRR